MSAADQGPRIGVYVCHCGGNISDVVDVEKVVDAAARLPGVVVAKANVFMCSDPGQNAILEDVKNEGLDGIVVAACSPKLHETTFRKVLERGGLNPYLLEQANIREQVSWASDAAATATEKATALVAAAVAKASRLRALEPIRVDTTARAIFSRTRSRRPRSGCRRPRLRRHPRTRTRRPATADSSASTNSTSTTAVADGQRCVRRSRSGRRP